MTTLDGLVILIILLSAFLAMVRGFSREMLSLLSWVISGLLAYFLYKHVLPLCEQYISNHTVATAVTITGIFLIALIIISTLTMKLADIIIDSRIGGLDRTLGFIFGIVRGVLILAVAILFINALITSNQPAWIANAKTKPILNALGNRVWKVFHKDILQKLEKRANLLKTPAPPMIIFN
ncbi:MAG: membrane protein required for colicin V production [Candidatus Tokpelaia sp. JSC189]|nr:MAG: membrane protein required for colicin V production [Candidatus Tokpelaia sp. JSC189]